MTEPTTPSGHQRHLRKKAADEFTKLVIIFGYLWIVFEFVFVHKSIVLSEYHLSYPEHAFAIVNSLVFGKILLTRNCLWDIVLKLSRCVRANHIPARVKPTCGQSITGFVHPELDCPHQIEPTYSEVFNVSLQNGVPLKVHGKEGLWFDLNGTAMKWDNTERYLPASITFADGAFESGGVEEHLAQTCHNRQFSSGRKQSELTETPRGVAHGSKAIPCRGE